MKALVDLLEGWHPGIAEGFEPAREGDIDELGALAGELPGAYLRFLRTMGGSTGDWNPGDAFFDLANVTAAHARLLPGEGGWFSPFLLVGVVPVTPRNHYFIDRGSQGGQQDGMVVRMQLGDDAHRLRLHASFEEFLYYEAFRTERLPKLAFRRSLRRPIDKEHARECSAETVCAWAESRAFRRIPPATRCALYERGDAAILLYRSPSSERFSVVVGAEQEAESARLVEELQRATGVEMDPAG